MTDMRKRFEKAWKEHWVDFPMTTQTPKDVALWAFQLGLEEAARIAEEESVLQQEVGIKYGIEAQANSAYSCHKISETILLAAKNLEGEAN